MKIRLLVLLMFFMPFIYSCANTGKITQVINPKSVNKDKLEQLPHVYTPKHKFKVSTVSKFKSKLKKIVEDVDKKFDSFSKCENIKDKGLKAKKYKIAVVDGTFECEFHKGRCNGEIDSDSKLIIVSYESFNREGILPLLKHEWAHAYKILKSDHSNLDEVKKCTKY